METLIAVLTTTFATQFIKKYIKPKWGTFGVHSIVFLIALVFAFGTYLMGVNDSFKTMVIEAGKVMAYSITIYQLLIKGLAKYWA